MKKNMGVLLALTLILCFGLPASVLADNLFELYTFAGIPWDTKPEDLVDVFDEKAGIVMENIYDTFSILMSSRDQAITIAGRKVDTVMTDASEDMGTFDGVYIMFDDPNYSASSLDKYVTYKTFIASFLELMGQLNEKYGEYDNATLTLEPKKDSITSYLLEPVSSSENWYRFADACLDKYEARLFISWRNITLYCIINNASTVPSCSSVLHYASTIPELPAEIETFDLNSVESRDSVSLGI